MDGLNVGVSREFGRDHSKILVSPIPTPPMGGGLVEVDYGAGQLPVPSSLMQVLGRVVPVRHNDVRELQPVEQLGNLIFAW